MMDYTFQAEDQVLEYAAVMQGAADRGVKACTGANVEVWGIAQYGRTTAEIAAGKTNVRVRYAGVSKALAGGIIARGGKCVVNGTSGKMKAAPASAGTVDNIVGIALETTASGDTFRMLVNIAYNNVATS